MAKEPKKGDRQIPAEWLQRLPKLALRQLRAGRGINIRRAGEGTVIELSDDGVGNANPRLQAPAPRWQIYQGD